MVSVVVKAAAVLAAVLLVARGEQRPPGAPAAPAAAGGSGCWACCSLGCCSWGCSSASLLWVRGDGGRAGGPTVQLPIQRAEIGYVPSVGHQCRALCCRWGNRLREASIPAALGSQARPSHSSFACHSLLASHSSQRGVRASPITISNEKTEPTQVSLRIDDNFE